MRSEQDIERSIREKLPLIFDASSPKQGTFLKKFEALLAYASNASEPFLKEDTLRYQSVLVKLSLIFLSLSLLKIREVKVADYAVSVDRWLLILYAGLIVLVGIVFGTKAYVDHQRARFTRDKGADASSKALALIDHELALQNIQVHFWFAINDLIGKRYTSYDQAVAEARDHESDFTHFEFNPMTLNFDAIREIPALAAEVERLEAFATQLDQELAADAESFRVAARRVLDAKPIDDPFMVSRHSRYAQIEDAFAAHLQNWFEVRNRLGLGAMSYGGRENPNVVRIKAVGNVLKRIQMIRGVYAAIEVIAPIGLAMIAIVYIASRELLNR